MKAKKETSKLITNCRLCGQAYSVEFKGKVAGMIKAEAELADKIKNCGCNIDKVKGFNEDESTLLNMDK